MEKRTRKMGVCVGCNRKHYLRISGAMQAHKRREDGGYVFCSDIGKLPKIEPLETDRFEEGVLFERERIQQYDRIQERKDTGLNIDKQSKVALCGEEWVLWARMLTNKADYRYCSDGIKDLHKSVEKIVQMAKVRETLLKGFTVTRDEALELLQKMQSTRTP